MKILICSDIHGDAEALEAILKIYDDGSFDKLLLLGDVLYHGPRNDLPPSYAPKKVIQLLNERKREILAVRGNCDTEVDQMVLEFPILADYAYLSLEGISVFATHGHKFNTSDPTLFKRGEILLHGHTHIQCIEPFGDSCIYINPGSVSLPKGGNPKTYAEYENRTFTIKTLDGQVINTIAFE